MHCRACGDSGVIKWYGSGEFPDEYSICPHCYFGSVWLELIRRVLQEAEQEGHGHA